MTTAEGAGCRPAVRQGLPADWDELVGHTSPTARYRWFSLIGTRLPGPALVFRHGGGRPAVLCGTLLTAPPRNRRIDPYAVFAGAAAGDGLNEAGPHPWRGAPVGERFPCLFFMLPNYEFFPVGPGADDRGTLRGLVTAVREWCADNGVRSIAFLYLSPEANALAEVLDESGFAVIPLTTRCELPVTWEDSSGYLHALDKKRRGAARREMRELAARGVVTRERPLDGCLDRLVQLRCGVVAKYGGRPDVERERALLLRVRSLFPPEDLTVVVAEAEGEILGFTLMVRDGHLWTAFMTGTDYSTDRARLTYFATAYYRPAELAPGMGIRKIVYGPGSWHAKRLRGCVEVPLGAAAGDVKW
ncbi:GNAT family N-acetyltransferase [Actinomadura rubrisoli]|uniref:GNAT family N-acetyltransferase n=1 Tax=Actinomadura rubrisoli TaxID=2530368 RepID=A0A4R5ACA8_9ACTN|nr:GNAT family N-acetyltransferase [Actinomadura rubrisoli]TDD68669.1 GNAT family N-acetyltransferase [Actinomadura rubrisoli]